MSDRIVAIGLLSQRDLDILGQGFNCHFPIEQDHIFDDLIAKLKEIPFPDDKENMSGASC